ncbi:MAG: hypothetical protein HY043_17985 [Verrucomicrobia bacterium]|nr:hypothetical protein [Verrucomicrobiota bacterium]
MRLQQGQIWQLTDEYLRIVHLERLEVKYKRVSDLVSKVGTHHHVTKKEFCRLIKNAKLVSPTETSDLSSSASPAKPTPGEI